MTTQAAAAPSNATGIAATSAATAGLVFGPSTMLVFTFGVFIAPLSAAFGWTRPAIAFGSTIIALAIMVIAPLQGWLVDRFGGRRVVLTSIPLFAAGLFFLSRMGDDIRMFYLLCAVLPVLGLGLWPTSYLRVVSTWFDRRLGLAIGIANGGIGIGAALVPVVATAVMGQGGWRTAYLVLAVLALAVTWPLNFFFLREAADPAPRRAAGPVLGGMAYRDILRTGSYRLLLVGFFLTGIINVGMIVNQVPLLIDGGVSPERAAAAQATFGLALLITRFLTGVLLDRVPAPLLMGAVCIGGLAACLLYASGVNDVSLVICPILIAMVVGAEFDVLSYIVKKYYGIASFGRAYGVVYSVFQLGAALGATALPLSRLHLGSYAPGLFGYAAILAAASVCFLTLRPNSFANDTLAASARPIAL